MNISFANEDMLLLRLKALFKKGDKCSFLFGSGLTLPSNESQSLGVLGVNEIIQLIREIFKKHDSLKLFESTVNSSNSPSNDYQRAMELLLNCFGQDQVNEVIAQAVLRARIKRSTPLLLSNDLNFEDVEKDIENWYLNKGLMAFGKLVTMLTKQIKTPVLTSNFDPLLEVAIRKMGGSPQSIFLVNDGKFSNFISDDTIPVLHFHGFWRKDDTLHTSEQITRARPQLKGDLKKTLSDSTLVVIGYGGWDDVFTNTLIEIVQEGSNNFNLLWAFFQNDEKNITEANKQFFDKIKSSVGQRIILYKGIDSNVFLPKLVDALNGQDSAAIITPDLRDLEEKSSKYPFAIEAKNNFACDSPPANFYWVGRKSELELLSSHDYKAFFVTGIGGQGKSALVSYYIQNCITQTEDVEFWDWRDCKEEDNRIHTILISVIERLTKGNIRANQLNDEKIEDIVELFFSLLANRKIVFVFDNVDYYVDIEKACPTRGIAKLFEYANTIPHNCKFIFTCRPRVKSTSTVFLEIPLKELSLDDTIELFKQYKIPCKENELIELADESHKVTNGHALWLSLIAAQGRSGKDAAFQCLREVKMHTSFSSDNPSYQLAENTLSVVWKTLNHKQQIMLRGMAEMVTSVSEENLQKILVSELNTNQFNKSLKALRNLNLVVIKSAGEDKEHFELHPLVKEFVLSKYKRNERSKFITLLVNFYDSLIVIIKPKLSSNSPLSYFENWLHKVELQINKGDYTGALLSLQEVKESIQSAGYYEPFLRVAMKLFIEIDWFNAITKEYPYFHSVLHDYIHTLIDFGRYDDADAYLSKYARMIEGKGAQYISMCNLYSYFYWSKESFSQAIDWAERGLDLANSTGINQDSDLRHSMALALRDTKQPESITKALNIFLKGEILDDLLKNSSDNEGLSGSYYGNVGRCLWFLGDLDKAFICYKRSASLLLEEKYGNTKVNQGYAFYWLGQLFVKKNLFEEARKLFLKSINIWNKSAPLKALKVQKEYENLIKEKKLDKTIEFTEWEIDKFSKELISK